MRARRRLSGILLRTFQNRRTRSSAACSLGSRASSVKCGNRVCSPKRITLSASEIALLISGCDTSPSKIPRLTSVSGAGCEAGARVVSIALLASWLISSSEYKGSCSHGQVVGIRWSVCGNMGVLVLLLNLHGVWPA